MKSLIIGGAGFVGAYLIRHLRDDLKHEVFVTKMHHESITAKDICVLDLDILNKSSIVSVIKKVNPQYIFHLAAQSSVALSWKNPALTIDVNVKGTVNMLDAVLESGVQPRILLIGSGEEYGHILPHETPVQENNPLRPGNVYAATKACQNMIGKIYADAYNMDIMMARAFNHTGPNQAPMFVVADFCKQVAEIEAQLREPVMRVGNLSARRDFTDVRDVVRAYGLLMEKGQKGEVYNIGSGRAVSIESILKQILTEARCSISIEIDPQKLRPVDIPVIEANTDSLYACTNWKPGIPLEQTIKETLDYYREVIVQ